MENPHKGFCSNWAATALLLMYAGLTAVGGPLSKEMKRAGVRAGSAAVGPAARWGKREEPRWAFMISVGLVTQLGGPCGVMMAKVSRLGGRRNHGEKQVKAFVGQVLDMVLQSHAGASWSACGAVRCSSKAKARAWHGHVPWPVPNQGRVVLLGARRGTTRQGHDRAGASA